VSLTTRSAITPDFAATRNPRDTMGAARPASTAGGRRLRCDLPTTSRANPEAPPPRHAGKENANRQPHAWASPTPAGLAMIEPSAIESALDQRVPGAWAEPHDDRHEHRGPMPDSRCPISPRKNAISPSERETRRASVAPTIRR